MFGYVREYAPELKVKELSLYKAVYCGLCRSMGKCTGNCSRLTLSYDITFLAVVRLALENKGYCVKKRRCFVHPLRKRAIMERNSVIDYCARASAVLSYGKALDDIKDSRGIKRLLYGVVGVFLKGAKKRAGLDDLYGKMTEKLEKLDECEKKGTKSVDIPSDIFGELVSDILSYGLDGETAAIAKSIGFYTGKWIYTADALDDMKKDAKSGSYNPFNLMFPEGIPEKDGEMIKGAFVHSLAGIEMAADLIECSDESLKGIIYNIIYCGMKRKSDEITDKIITAVK